ncbi:DUF2905 domain-containing protein [Desulfothermus naphthae]
MNEIGKLLIQIGIFLIIIGIIVMIFPKIPTSKFPLGRLPGDIYIDKPGFKFYFPWVSCLLASIILSFIFYLFRK